MDKKCYVGTPEIQATVPLVVATRLHSAGVLNVEQAARLADLSEAAFQASIAAADQIACDAPASTGMPGELSLPEEFRLSVLVPVYNERATIQSILERILLITIPTEILIVDDGSSDGTREILRDQIEERYPNVRVFYHERNRGKGAAVRTAIAEATGGVCVIQDADLEYDPREYGRLLEPILDGRADAVYGSRFIGGGPHRVHLFWHYVGNNLLTTLSNMLTNLNLTDMETCYKVVRTDLLRSLPLRANGFDLEPELTALLAKARARIYEVPISYSGRDYAEGKKITWKDGVRAIHCILRSSLRRLDSRQMSWATGPVPTDRPREE